MSNKWLFKIDLKDESVFDEYESVLQISFPEELKSFVIENNASSPELNGVEFNGVERVYDETLSFNRYEDEASTFLSAMNSVGNKAYLPFAKDPFGNYFCYCIENGTVCFYNHEEDNIEKGNISFKKFIEVLQ
ncbi:MAG: SMI1/KNR4 family protein [Lachnospiraceae bacterium]|nr:SMI1/KNR4 family protein [Lachnospiraceae bacterium]